MSKDAQVMTHGEAVVCQRPSTLFMQVQLVETASSVEAALSNAKQRVAAARQLLEALEAAPGVVWDDGRTARIVVSVSATLELL